MPVGAAAWPPAVTVAAEAMGWICGKRLVAILSELGPALEAEGALRLTPEARVALLGVSAATIERRLTTAKARAKPRGLGTTKPSSLLKQQVPIRTYTPWDDQRPGFVELNLVAHCGTTTASSYLGTLDVVDVATGWTECVGVLNMLKKGQAAVFAALEQVRSRLPFPLLSPYSASIPTTGASSPTTIWCAIASRSNSPLPAAGATTRMTKPMSNRSTGRSFASSWATTGTRARSR